jgi:diaminohydroxyphosphoribosylaminopyrimidine deaminase/5-amino-6-(5-phosphoribosylamino)uracil reductase
MAKTHEDFMREAIELSKRGYPAPNPRVGAVVVNNGEVVGRGWHNAAGGDHAEVVALREAGALARGANMYVTLEPCKHHGKTPPCVEAIRSAGIAQTYFAVRDPNPDAAGGGEALDAIGGIVREEAAQANRVFLRSFELGRPYVLVKCATTLDGCIATDSGESKWITGEAARKRGQALRAEMGCVLIGGRTALLDNPSLTVREFGVVNQPLRVVLDARGDLPLTLQIFSDGLATVHVKGGTGIAEVLEDLWSRGVRGVLVEGGGKTIGRFFDAGLVDEVELHVAPKILGGGRRWCDGVGADQLADAFQLRDVQLETLGEDIQIRGLL